MLMSSTFRRSLKRRLDATSLFRKPRPLKPVNPHEVAPSRFLGFMLDESSEDEDEEVEISEKLDPT
ncbi:MAG: uncharacterized protein KVP18_000759 [Porospora cf. gigantea A]|nr:MAG: hypothetical protein KVP18_000759 [Porospora cf. gigantea A]